MSAPLESLPEELKLMVSESVIGPNGLEVGLQMERTHGHHAAYLIDTPEWQGLTSLQLTSRELCGPASEVFRKCDTLSVNLFHTPIVTDTTELQSSTGNHSDEVSLPGRFVSDKVFKNFNKLNMTVPFHFMRGHNKGKDGGNRNTNVWKSLNYGPITDVLLSCTMKFERASDKDGIWTCHSVTVEQESEDEGWNFDPETIEEAVQHIKQHAPLLACQGLNVEAVGGRFYEMIPVGPSTPNNATRALTSHRLVMAIQHYLTRIDPSTPYMYPKFPLRVKSRRSQRWHLAPAWNWKFEVEHTTRPDYSEDDEKTESG